MTLALLFLLFQSPDSLLQRIDAKAEAFGEISKKIWTYAETAFKETKSAGLLRDELKQAGFAIEENIGGLPTAFTATWGQGKPVIAIIGEYDALPGMSQEVAPGRKPVVDGGAGHGCAHNLFGTGSALAAIALKEHLQANRIGGTVRFYGTPAEENGAGKVYMIRAGAFRDVDVALAWHPASWNAVDDNPWLANVMAKFRFHGIASHAAAAPEAGRSALDAVEIMNHAVNLLREHVPQETRMHYYVSQGGAAANIVPEFAETTLIARHPDVRTLEGIWERLLSCAQAGALATETRMELEITSGYANMQPNPTLVKMIDANLRRAGGVTYTLEETAFAEALRKQVTSLTPYGLGSQEQIQPPYRQLLSASTDVGDVSQIVPTGHFYAATMVPGVPFHTWQATACAGSSIGRKGMLVAAKTLALTALELFRNPAQVAAAKADFDKARGGRPYRSLIPEGRKPTLPQP